MVINRQLLERKLKDNNMNYRILADIMGVSRATLSNIVNGRNKPSYDIMHSIMTTLNLESQDFIDIFITNPIKLSIEPPLVKE